MQLVVQIAVIIFNLALLSFILILLFKRHLREEFSLIWLLGILVVLWLSISKGALARIAEFLGVSYPPSILFALTGLFFILILLSFAVSITSLVRNNRDLAQRIALLEWHIKQIQGEPPKDQGQGIDPKEEDAPEDSQEDLNPGSGITQTKNQEVNQ